MTGLAATMTPIRIEILSLQSSRVPAAGNAGHRSPPDLWEPESCPFNHRKSFAARRGGVTQCGLMFPDGGSPPRKQNFWASLGTNLGMDVGRTVVGRRDTWVLESWTPLDWEQPTRFPDTRRHCQSISWPHLACQFTHMPIFYDEVLISLHTHARACLDINTMRGVSNQSCVHEKLLSPRTFRYLCRKQWTRIGPRPVKAHPS